MKDLMRHLTALLGGVLLMGATACGGCGEAANNQQNNPECAAGEPGCACTVESTCSSGAVCTEGVCEGVVVSGLTISSPEARSCELLLQESAGRVLGATYADGVQGAWRKRAPNVAVAISQTSDAPLPAGVVRLEVGGDAAGVTIAEVSCFDAQGARLDGVRADFE